MAPPYELCASAPYGSKYIFVLTSMFMVRVLNIGGSVFQPRAFFFATYRMICVWTNSGVHVLEKNPSKWFDVKMALRTTYVCTIIM